MKENKSYYLKLVLTLLNYLSIHSSILLDIVLTSFVMELIDQLDLIETM